MNNQVKKAIDAMGGVNAPKKILDGISLSLKTNKDNFFFLYGQKDKIETSEENIPLPWSYD